MEHIYGLCKDTDIHIHIYSQYIDSISLMNVLKWYDRAHDEQINLEFQ